MTSHERIALLNTGDRDLIASITFLYEDRDPIGPYRLTVAARRVRQVRVNDLIDPEAVPLDTPYGCIVEADAPIVVQFSRQDTSGLATARVGTVAHPVAGR